MKRLERIHSLNFHYLELLKKANHSLKKKKRQLQLLQTSSIACLSYNMVTSMFKSKKNVVSEVHLHEEHCLTR